VFLIAALLLAVSEPPLRTGDCRWVHGRFNLWDGSSVRRIWIIGTHRIVALRDEDSDVPPVIKRYLYSGFYPTKADGLFGDFKVCALEPNQMGHMQHVRLQATENLTFRGRPFALATK
jgi:hypothetical protein